MTLLVIGISSATITDIEYECAEDDCTEGNLANWSIFIHNEGETAMDLNTIRLIDPETQITIVSKKFTNTSIFEGDKIIIVIDDIMPPPNYLDTKLRYKPCIRTNVAIDWRYLYGITMESCDFETYEMPDRPLLYRDCENEVVCNFNEICRNSKCIRFRCGECQYIAAHMCVSHRCCASVDCWENEKCVDNDCVKLICTNDEYISEHGCSKLVCKDDEFAYNHECIKLVCADDEEAKENKCKKLDCANNEFVLDNKCVPFECPFLRSARDGQCVVHRGFIYTLILVFLVVIGLRITAFIVNKKQDVKRYKKAIQPCPNCGVKLKPYASVCPACRYDIKKFKKQNKKR
jgi:hypothetical protein